MDARTIIETLRDGGEPTQAQLNWFAKGLASGAVSDAQAGAFAMAVCLKGLSEEARVALTLAMRDSGDVLSWDLGGPAIDKHSTGGIGDCVSLLLAPMLAAAGAYVPMISGRGLGHTGGTLDKLEAIPGLRTDVTEDQFHRITKAVGCAIVSATADMAPADRRLYAVRDVTSTVESIDLITASILSKKLAAGLDALILDVKTGSGAFMETLEDARALARSLVSTANGAGCRTAALLTDMNQPLVPAAGNALEVVEVMRALSDPRTSRLTDVTLALGAELLCLAGIEADAGKAGAKLLETLTSGKAAEAFGRMVGALGGPSDFIHTWATRLPEANIIRELSAPEAGYVTAIDGHALGMAVVRLGGGRMRDGDRIDPSVGLDEIVSLGQRVEKGAPLLRIHASSDRAAQAAEASLAGAIRLGDAVDAPDLIIERVG
ncbi:thymidine phosphorylase [Alphaproteobacteria bacterium GH1-50]|uniref:Thymidine phosphorylase n=1 Tax=Kangsaoukella pontilimi TaxID=2691042 RepID=A0A7C9MB31_9RHOB|nr:thymidine phosphorylase [Kangsaoukella pontilimi]MXQ06571.1 thymidine phosphorylase [Kangsaoukella pontilimi]